MVTLLFLCRRRPELSRSAYTTHLLERHAPLALRHHAGLRHYAIHLVEESRDGAEPIDSINALGFDSLADFLERPYASPEGERLVTADHARFLGGALGYATREERHGHETDDGWFGVGPDPGAGLIATFEVERNLYGGPDWKRFWRGDGTGAGALWRVRSCQLRRINPTTLLTLEAAGDIQRSMARTSPVSTAPPPRARRRDADANRVRILRAARELISERGPEGLTVSAVAHRAGLNRTTAYQHFRTREELVAAAMGDLAVELTAMLVEENPIDDQIDRISEYFLDHPEIARLWIYQLLAETRSEDDRGWQLYQAQLRDLVSGPQAKPGVDPEMLGRILVSASLIWSLLARMTTPDDASAREANRRFTRELKRLLLYGVLEPDHWPELVEDVK